MPRCHAKHRDAGRYAALLSQVVIGLVALAATPGMAQAPRPFCPDRPGLGTPACTLSPGDMMSEIGLVGWSREHDAETRTNEWVAVETLMRVGLTERLEGQIGWAGFGFDHVSDRASGRITESWGTGDLTVTLRRNLHNPDGSGFSIAAMPYADIPVGRAPIGAGDWGAGVILPVTLALDDALTLTLTPQIDAVVDDDGHGRHLGFGSIFGVDVMIGKSLTLTSELSVYRNDDPQSSDTITQAGLSAGWQANDTLQFDIGVNIGLNDTSPDGAVYIGIAKRF